MSVIVLCNLNACDATTIVHQVAGLIDPAIRLPDPKSAALDPEPQRTRALREALGAWVKSEPHSMMGPAFAARVDPGARTAAMRRQVGEQLSQSIAFHFLAEDDVRARNINRSGSNVARIVHCGLMTAKDAHAFRFHLDERGSLLDIHVEGW